MDPIAGLTAVGVAVGGIATWRQSKRASFTTITSRLDRELKYERRQRKLLTSYVVDLMRWARDVPAPPTPVPEPPPDLDLSPWD